MSKENNSEISESFKILRLSNEHKSIYFFLITHNLSQEDKPLNFTCDDVLATEIDQYFLETFTNASHTNSTITYDFYFEHANNNLSTVLSNEYIRPSQMIARDFSKIFMYKKIKANGIDILNNVSIYPQHNVVTMIGPTTIHYYYHLYVFLINVGTTHNIMTKLTINDYILDLSDIIACLTIFVNIINNPDKKILELSDEQLDNNFCNRLEHFIVSANDSNIDSNFKIIIDPILKSISAELNNSIELLGKIDSLLHEILLRIGPHDRIGYLNTDKEFVQNVGAKMREYLPSYKTILYTLGKLGETFFIRNVVNKKNTNNIVRVASIYSALPSIQLLINNFDYSITHVSYTTKNNIDELNAMFKNCSNYLDLEKELYTNKINNIPDRYKKDYDEGKILYSCSSIKNFPLNFI
jgi:hypothetical protein